MTLRNALADSLLEAPVQLVGVQLTKPPPQRNPGEFNYAFYLTSHGIVATGYATDVNPLPQRHPTLWQIIARFRSHLLRSFDDHFSQPYAGFLKALVLGYRFELDNTIKQKFQLAGLMHVLAISGLHVGLLTLFLFTVFRLVQIPSRWHYGILMLFLIGYSMVTGAQPPVIRATVMITLWSIGKLLSRQVNPLNVLFAAVLGILMVQPNQLFWVGFQLSFLAVLFILIGMQGLSRWQWLQQFQQRSMWHYRLVKYGIIPVWVTAWAQLGTLPIVIQVFHIFSPISFLLNLIVIPGITLILYLSILYLIVTPITPGIGRGIAWATQGILQGVWHVVDRAVALPFSSFEISSSMTVPLALLAIGALVCVGVPSRRMRIISGYSLLLLFLGWQFWHQIRQPQADFIAIDVGQGDALVFRTASGKVVLIDTGPGAKKGDRPFRAIQSVFNHLGIHHIHRLLISHPHWDHMGNLLSILQQYPVDSLYYPGIAFQYRWQDSVRIWAQRANVPTRALNAGQIVPVDESSRLFVLSPFLPPGKAPKGIQVTGRVLNNHSLVVLLKMGKTAILLPGDAEQEAERNVLVWGQWLKATILKAPHHGSRTSSIAKWLKRVHPDVAILSVGEGNRFGHPHPDVLKRYHQLGIRILRTDKNGAIWLQYRKHQWETVPWRKGNRFYIGF